MLRNLFTLALMLLAPALTYAKQETQTDELPTSSTTTEIKTDCEDEAPTALNTTEKDIANNTQIQQIPIDIQPFMQAFSQSDLGKISDKELEEMMANIHPDIANHIRQQAEELEQNPDKMFDMIKAMTRDSESSDTQDSPKPETEDTSTSKNKFSTPPNIQKNTNVDFRKVYLKRELSIHIKIIEIKYKKLLEVFTEIQKLTPFTGTQISKAELAESCYIEALQHLFQQISYYLKYNIFSDILYIADKESVVYTDEYINELKTLGYIDEVSQWKKITDRRYKNPPLWQIREEKDLNKNYYNLLADFMNELILGTQELLDFWTKLKPKLIQLIAEEPTSTSTATEQQHDDTTIDADFEQKQ